MNTPKLFVSTGSTHFEAALKANILLRKMNYTNNDNMTYEHTHDFTQDTEPMKQPLFISVSNNVLSDALESLFSTLHRQNNSTYPIFLLMENALYEKQQNIQPFMKRQIVL